MSAPTLFVNVYNLAGEDCAWEKVHTSREAAFAEAKASVEPYAYTLTDIGKIVFKLKDDGQDDDDGYTRADWALEHSTYHPINGRA